MSFDIKESSQRFIGATRDNENKLTVDVDRNFTLVSAAPSNQLAARQALAQAGVFNGASHPDNPFYFCSRVQIDQVSPIFFTARADYRSPAFTEGENQTGDPVLEPPKIMFSTTSTTERVDTDINDDAIATATGELYEDVTRRVSDLVATIKRNYAIFQPQSFYEFYDTVNDDVFLGFPVGTGLITDLQAQPQVLDNYLWWEVTVQITFRRPFLTTADNAWKVRRRHQGYYCFDASNNLIRAEDDLGAESVKPVPLDATGKQQAGSVDPVWLYFEVYERSTFADMNLGV